MAHVLVGGQNHFKSGPLRCRQQIAVVPDYIGFDIPNAFVVGYGLDFEEDYRNLPDVSTRHVASIVYEYQPKVLAKEKDRIENPFGFVVTAYRSDPEIASPPTALAARQ